MEPTFSSRFASELIDFAAERGGDRAELISLTNLSPTAMNREDIRIPCTTMSLVWSTAMDQTGDTRLAMNLGISRMLGATRTTSLLMEASSTVLESFQLAVQYSALIADVMAVELGEIDDTIYIEFRARDVWRDQPEAVQLDCLAISYVAAATSLNRLLGTHHPPRLLSLAFPAPADTAIWVEVFGCSPKFGAEHNRIGFPAELKSASVATGDPGLKAAIRHYADELSDGFGGEPPMTRAVMAAIVDGMSPQPPSLDAVARTLGIGARSLQRQLKAEGYTYRRLVERVRMDLSERHLRDGRHSVDQVALLAGYADTSSFVRAFKRCKGQPPRRYSRQRS